MPDHPNPEKKKSLQSSDDIQVPPIPKQTAGAVTGAAIGSIAGPAGALVGGVIGAVVGKAAADGRPVRKAVRRATAVSKGALKRHPVKKSLTKSRKGGGGGYAPKVRKGRDLENRPQRSRRSERYARANLRSRQRSTSSRARQKRRSGRTKRR